MQYRRIKLIGHGGMATVYEVEDTQGNRYALKELTARFNNISDELMLRSAFQNEARLLCQLRHPNIVQGIEYFVNGGKQCLVMELLVGYDLDKTGRLMPPVAIALVQQIASALEYLHSQTPPIIHRDLKLGNCFLHQGCTIKLLDLGIAKTIKAVRKHQGDVAHYGTPPFAAPEQYEGYADERTDIYALGAIFYYLLSGMLPPDAPTRLANDTAFQNSLLLLPRPLQGVIKRALALEPQVRYANVAEFLTILQELQRR